MKAHIFLSLLLVTGMVLAESPGSRRAKNTADDVMKANSHGLAVNDEL